MKNKKMLVAAVALVAVIALFAGVFVMTRPETSQGSKTITVTVVHSDERTKEFVCKTDEEYLGPVLLAENIVVGEEGPYGLMIHAVDGETASWEENQSYWAIYVGEEYATVGMNDLPIEDGGVYKLEYTIG